MTPQQPWWERVGAATVEEYVALVRDSRQLRRLHDRTGCEVTRRELARLEDQVDRFTDQLARELAPAGQPAPVPAIPAGPPATRTAVEAVAWELAGVLDEAARAYLDARGKDWPRVLSLVEALTHAAARRVSVAVGVREGGAP